MWKCFWVCTRDFQQGQHPRTLGFDAESQSWAGVGVGWRGDQSHNAEAD